MVAVTYGGARVAVPAEAGTKIAKKTTKTGKGFFVRLYDSLVVSQMKRADLELARHRHLLPPDFELQSKHLSRSEDREPFGGW